MSKLMAENNEERIKKRFAKKNEGNSKIFSFKPHI